MNKRYDEYKPTGVEWMPEIPVHWQMRKVGHSFRSIGSGTTPNTDTARYYLDADVNWINTGDLNDGYLLETKKMVSKAALEELSALRVYPSGSLIVAMYGATIGKLAITAIEGCTNQACAVLADSSVFHIRYAFYWFLASKQHILTLASGGGQPNINQELIRALKIPTPLREEQQSIVQFLDDKTAQLDQLIAQKQQMLTLLREERAALINHAVTKGLDAAAPLRDSGIAWLGEVPAHWDIRKVGHSFDIIGSGTTPNTDNREYYENGTINWINTGDLNDGYLTETKKQVTETAINDLKTLRIYPTKSLVVAMYGATIGKLSITEIEGCTNQACSVLAESSVFQVKYAYYWFLAAKEHIITLASGGGQPNISQELIRSLRMTCPPEKEQREIIDYLDKHSAKIADTTDIINQEIALVQEYRAALIAEAVTGQIDVRHYEPATLEAAM